jgi:carbonyl reductase 1
MDKRVIAVTGAYRGIGYSILESLCQNPSVKDKIMILTSRKREEGQAALERLKKEYPLAKENLFYHHLDVAHGESIQKFINSINKDFGHLSVLYNNAAILHRNPPFERRDSELVEIFNTNVWGLIDMTETALRIMKPGSHIINISSRLGQLRFSKKLQERFLEENLTVDDLHKLYREYRHAYVKNELEKEGWDDKLHHYGCYGVSKVFVNAYTRILDKRFKKNKLNIKVNAVCPGWCRTEMGGKDAPREPLKGAETPVWLESFSNVYDENLSGNFYADKKTISWL